MTNSPQANLGTAPKLWSDRDFDECCYPVSGFGPETMVCAEPCRGSYCIRHRKQMDARLDVRHKPPRKRVRRVKQKAPTRPAATRRTLKRTLPESLVRRIRAEVAAQYGLSIAQLSGSGRDYAHARQHVAWRLRSLIGSDGFPLYSFPVIGGALGVDQSTVQYSVRRISERLPELLSTPLKRPGDPICQGGFAESQP